jgi:hypothetical protein
MKTLSFIFKNYKYGGDEVRDHAQTYSGRANLYHWEL